MNGFLSRQFEDNTVIWFLVTVVLAGIVAEGLRYLFGTVASARFESRQTARKMFRKYRYPLLYAADSLDRRLENMITFAKEGWYDEDDEYYRLSTLYVFGRYLGWCCVLEDAAFIDYFSSNSKARKFSLFFCRVFKAMTGFRYLSQVPNWDSAKIEAVTLPRFARQAIGELMFSKDEQATEAAPRMLAFNEFVTAYKANARPYQQWFAYLDERILAGVRHNPRSVRWNRLLVIATMLRALVIRLDPDNRQTTPRQIRYLQWMHPLVRGNVLPELEEMGLKKRIVLDSRHTPKAAQRPE